MLAYELDCSPLRAAGFVVDDEGAAAVAPTVRAILRDDTGVAEAREALVDVAKTDFESEILERVLAPRGSYEEWRVGEAVAEVHLSQVEGCTFPWPDSRSLRNPSSSSGGVDLLGIHDGDRIRFVFAEVKTSHQQAWPPSVVTSRSHGLHGQLTGLMAGDARLQAGIRYLVMNGVGRPWLATVKEAVATYLRDQSDVMLFGVLVHAADPNPADLENLATRLASTHADPTSSCLVALYATGDVLAAIADAVVELETAA